MLNYRSDGFQSLSGSKANFSERKTPKSGKKIHIKKESDVLKSESNHRSVENHSKIGR